MLFRFPGIEELLLEPITTWKHIWDVQCYNSFDYFISLFPTEESRAKIICQLKQEAVDSEFIKKLLIDTINKLYEKRWDEI